MAQLNDALHVWIAYPDRIASSRLAHEHFDLLSIDEQQRCARFHFESDRHHYLAAHALLRHALSHYGTLAPQAWRFIHGHYGKPAIDPALDQPPLRFNLTHTSGLVACVLTSNRDCGIDVERIRPMKDLRGLAGTVFSENELSIFDGHPAESQLTRFFQLWTIKEAYIKATGSGLSAPLRQISFTITDNKISVEDTSDLRPSSDEWLFDLQAITAHHSLAVAASPANGIRSIVYHELDLARRTTTVVHRTATSAR